MPRKYRHGAGIDQVLCPDRGEGARHLGPVEIALIPHQVLQEGDLAFIEKQQELTRLSEIHLCRHQRDARQPVIPIARHRGGGDRQKRAAQAIPVGMNLPLRTDLADHVKRSHDAADAVILKAQIGLLGSGVAP